MSNISERLRKLSPGVKIFNASDKVQKMEYDSTVHVFPPGVATEIRNKPDISRDKYGRPEEDSMVYRGNGEHYPSRIVDNPEATAEKIAEFYLSEAAGGPKKGLCLDGVDDPAAAKKRWVAEETREAKAVEARWLQKVLDAKAAGSAPPQMPEYVEQAQDFLIQYRGAGVSNQKRFVVTLDSRSFNTKDQARKHISARYPAQAEAWESLVNDTDPQAEEEQPKEPKKRTAPFGKTAENQGVSFDGAIAVEKG